MKRCTWLDAARGGPARRVSRAWAKVKHPQASALPNDGTQYKGPAGEGSCVDEKYIHSLPRTAGRVIVDVAWIRTTSPATPRPVVPQRGTSGAVRGPAARCKMHEFSATPSVYTLCPCPWQLCSCTPSCARPSAPPALVGRTPALRVTAPLPGHTSTRMAPLRLAWLSNGGALTLLLPLASRHRLAGEQVAAQPAQREHAR